VESGKVQSFEVLGKSNEDLVSLARKLKLRRRRGWGWWWWFWFSVSAHRWQMAI